MAHDAVPDNVMPLPPRAHTDAGERPQLDVGSRGATAPQSGRRVQKTSERVASEIVRDIVAFGLRTGDRLALEAAMVEQYRVSRASLREALRLLEVQGLIRLKPGPGGGPVVGTVEPENLARMAALYFHFGAASYGHLLDAQALLEPLCAHAAAQSGRRRELMKEFLEALEPSTEEEYRGVTIGFHRAVYALVDNPVLTLITQAVTHIVTDHVVATMDPLELRPSILEEHAALARAIAAGHKEKARRLMALHFKGQHDYYRERWPRRLTDLVEWR